LLKDVSKMTQAEIAQRDADAQPILVVDKRRNFDVEAESNSAQVEPVHPEQMPETAEDGLPKEEPKPITAKDYPTLYVPSLIEGQQIKFRVGELLPWKGVFFIVAEVKAEPVPHMVLLPVDHTKAHKKIAAKSKQHAPRKKRIGGVTGS
jgi:hypothetical protein